MFATRVILILLCFQTALEILAQKSFSSIPCQNQVNARNGRVVGGADTKPGETRYIASLTRRGGHFCGATILNEKWLLTAGHCLCNGVNKIMKPTQLKAVLGLHKISDYQIARRNLLDNNLRQNTAEGPYEMDFKNIIIHPEYKCSDTANDIALLELYNPIEFTDNIQPACIAEKSSNTYAGTIATVSGWGWTNEDQAIGKRADTLQKASIEIWSNTECQESFRAQQKPHSITSTQMCAGKKAGGIDSCWADSGGPLTTVNNILIGVVSTGVGCARPGLPGIYTRVTEYVDWIENVVSE